MVASVPICWHVNSAIIFLNLMEIGTCFVAMSIAIDLKLSFVSMFLVSLVTALKKYSILPIILRQLKVLITSADMCNAFLDIPLMLNMRKKQVITPCRAVIHYRCLLQYLLQYLCYSH